MKRIELGILVAFWFVFLNMRHMEGEPPVKWNEVKEVVLEEYK